MTIQDLLPRLQGVHETSNGWEARCPSHEDKRASLTLSEGKDGRILLKCHAGCKFDAIVKGLGLKATDLFQSRNGHSKSGRIVATYDYVDEAGKLLFQVCRKDNKQFPQRHLGRNGEWIWNLEGVRRVLYRLPEIRKDMQRGLPVVIVEGEKDVAALVEREFSATCNPGGAGKWDASYSEMLRGADCIVIPDRDGPEKHYTGQRHAEQVADSLVGIAKRVRVVTLPGELSAFKLPVKDAHDYFSAGGTPEELIALIDAAPDWIKGTKIVPGDGEESKSTSSPWIELIEDGADLVTKDLPPIVEIVEGILTEQSKFVIGSSAKSNKTWVTIDMGLSISAGVPWWGRETLKSNVLYVNCELKPDTFARRVQILASAKGIKIERDSFLHLPLRGHLAGLSVAAIVDRIVQAALERERKVIVCDPVYKLNVEGEENNSRDQSVFFNQLDRVCTEAKCTLALCDHFSKGNQSEKDPLDAIRGSSAKGGDVDAAMILRKHEVEGCYRVDVIHRELPPIEPFCVGWNFPQMEIRTDLDPESMKKVKAGRSKGHDPRKLLAIIEDSTAENPISISAWAEQAEMSRQTLADYLPEMRRKGWITTVGQGNTSRQHITEKGRKEAGL